MKTLLPKPNHLLIIQLLRGFRAQRGVYGDEWTRTMEA